MEFFRFKCCSQLNQSKITIRDPLESIRLIEKQHIFKISDHSTASNQQGSQRSIIDNLNQSITDQILQNIQQNQEVVNLDDQIENNRIPSKKFIEKLPTIHQIKTDFINQQSLSEISATESLRLASSMPIEGVFPRQLEERMAQTQQFPTRKFKNPNNVQSSVSRIIKLQGKNIDQLFRFKKYNKNF